MTSFVIDSTFGVSEEYAKAHNIEIVSLSIDLDGNFVDEAEADLDEVYDYLERGLTTTSQPNPAAFRKAIDRIYAKDENASVLVLTISERLSGTISSANIAVMQYPEREIMAVDSMQTGAAGKLMVEELVKLNESGMSYADIVKAIKPLQQKISTTFVPENLDALVKGGRVSKLVAAFGSIFKIKPIFKFEKNNVFVAKKVLGAKKALNTLVEGLNSGVKRVVVMYTRLNENAKLLIDKAKEKFGVDNVDIVRLTPVIATHVGIGALGIAAIEA